jgi:hypothetical protein
MPRRKLLGLTGSDGAAADLGSLMKKRFEFKDLERGRWRTTESVDCSQRGLSGRGGGATRRVW